MNPLHITIGRRLSSLLAALIVLCSFAFSGDTGIKEIGRTTEKELNVVLSSSFGSVFISKGEPEKILFGESVGGTRIPELAVDYTIRNRVGYLDISIGEEVERKKGSLNVNPFDAGKRFLKFSSAIPISFDIQLGVGKGNFDMTGLQVKDFRLSTGASDVTLTFDEPNRTTIDDITIESGVSRFTGINLGNANFKRFKFHGGVGTYKLDFSGNLSHEVDVEIEVGLGVLTIVVPDEIGAKVFYQKSWVSRLDYDRDFRAVNDDQYITDNFNGADGRMNIRIDSGLGSVKVRRR
ncbi:MAG: hypothetical protein HY708_01780 [Ignavibacteriae bacterium]|nr:hypothetical protein [Ignavibacteriota bacterium]